MSSEIRSSAGPLAVLVVLILVALFVSITLIIANIRYKKMMRRNRRLFEERIGIPLPGRFRLWVNFREGAHTRNEFVLRYPVWRYARNNGCRDNRYRDNGVINRTSTLKYQEFTVTCENPLIMYDFVLRLRQKGIPVAPCVEEMRKSISMRGQVPLVGSGNVYSVDSIISRFMCNPFEFEYFIARLYQLQGWQAQTTKATGDGGVDVNMTDPAGETWIVECKCYNKDNLVGRPVLQKLLGANAIAGADHMMVVTTSDFTAAATDYSLKTGITLINGERLLELCNYVEAGNSSSLGMKSLVGIRGNDSKSFEQLTGEELLSKYPEDMRDRVITRCRKLHPFVDEFSPFIDGI